MVALVSGHSSCVVALVSGHSSRVVALVSGHSSCVVALWKSTKLSPSPAVVSARWQGYMDGHFAVGTEIGLGHVLCLGHVPVVLTNSTQQYKIL